jgi:hypothetical protein
MASPMDDKTTAHIPRSEHAEVTLKFEADTIKITERDKTKKAKKVSIRISREEAERIWKALSAKQLEGCFSKTLQASDPWDLFFEERQV